MIGLLKRQYLFGAEKLKWFLLFSGIKISGSLSEQNFYACARAKKVMIPRHSAHIPSRIKLP